MWLKQQRNVRAVWFRLYPFFCLIIENEFSIESRVKQLVSKKNLFPVENYLYKFFHYCTYSCRMAVVVHIIPVKQHGTLDFLVLCHIFTEFFNNDLALFQLSNSNLFLVLIGFLIGLECLDQIEFYCLSNRTFCWQHQLTRKYLLQK